MTDIRPDRLKAVQPEPGGAFVVPDGGSIDDIFAMIQAPDQHTFLLDEGDRQCVLLGLQTLRNERPGWDCLLGLLEAKLGGQMAWPPAEESVCYRCGLEKPAAQLVSTSAGGRYCLACIKTVEICRGCGCTDEVACPGGCWWVRPGACSNCAETV